LQAEQDARQAAENRDARAAELVLQANRIGSTVQDPDSPFETRAMITVRGKPATEVTVLGPGQKAGTVEVRYVNERGVEVKADVNRGRIITKATPRDPKALNQLPVEQRRAEQMRAKDLHQKQIDAILAPRVGPRILTTSENPEGRFVPGMFDAPQPATEAVPPSAATVEPTTDVGVSPPPPMAEAPVVQGEGSFVNETPVPLTDQPAPVNETPVPLTDQPVAEMPQSAAPQDQPMAGEGLTSYRMKSPYGYVMIGAKDPADAMREASRSTDNPNPADLEVWDGQKYVPVTQPASPSPVVAENTPPISASTVAERPQSAPRQGLNAVEDAAEKAGPVGALRQLAQRNPKYAPIANAVADRIEEMQSRGITVTFKAVVKGDSVPRKMAERSTRGLSALDNGAQTFNTYVAADSLGRYEGNDKTFDEVLLHEMIHVATQAQIFANTSKVQRVAGTTSSEGVTQLKSLYRAAITHFNKRIKAGNVTDIERKLYSGGNQGFKDVDEFVAWGMTNKEFQDYLDTIPYNKQSMFSAFVDGVRKALGIPAKEKSVLTGLIRTFEKVMAEPVADTKQNMDRVTAALELQRARQSYMSIPAQVTTGPAITNPDGPELAAAAEPMSTTDDDAVFAIQQVEQAALDPNFRSQVVLALRDEFRKLGFGSNIPLALEFTDAAGAAAMLKTQNGKQTIVIALGLANNTRDVPGAIQAMRPFLTHEVVEFAQKHDLLKPEERTVLLDYAKTHKAADGKTLYETVVERYGDLARANNQPEAYLEREAIAYATEYLTRLNPQKWGDSPQNPSSAARQRRRADPRAKNKPSAETKAANSFKDKIIAFGKSLFKGLEKAYPTKTADGSTLAQDIALRLAKGDIAHRARTNPRFVQEVKFAGWSAPPAEIKVLGTQLRNYLDSMGLSDVGLRMATGILNSDGKTWSAAASSTMGSYYARTITVSMEAYNPNLTYEQNLKNLIKVVDHEVVHALRATGAWSPNEWMNITKYVRTAKDPITNETYFEKAQRHYGSYVKGMQPAVAQDVLNEEAVAMAFADNFDIRIPRPTGPKRLLDRIAEVTLGLARAMHATGRPSAELLMANGNSVSEAVRAGIAAKNRRERGASSPAETSVKFSIAPDKMANVNPAMDPDAEDVFTQLNSIDPIADFFEKSKEQLADLFAVIERQVPWTQKLPGARMFAPMAEVEGHDAFKTLKGRTVGAIHELKETTAKLLEEGLRLTQKNPAARDAVNAYLETKGADPYSPRLPSGAKNPAYIENKRLRDITVAAKERMRLHGRIAVDLGFISQEAFDNLDGAYLHHMDITSDRKVINSQRLLLPDLSWTRKRRGLSEDERTLRGAVSNPFVSIGTYLSLSGEAFLIDRMYDHMLQWSKDRSEAGGRPWVMDTEHMINWRGQDWSPAAVEAEIEFLRGDVTDMARPTGVPDAKHDAKMATIERALKESRALLLRNPLWQKMHDTTAAEISQMLGVDPAQADLAKLDNATIQQVYDTVLRRRPKVRNEIDGPAGALADMAKDSVGAGAKFIGNDYVEIPDTARWGRLRGMAVDRALYDIMNATGAMFTKTVEDRAQVVSKEEKADPMSLLRKVISPEAYMIMHSTFKKLNTIYNLPTHGTNWAGNLVMFETMGGALPGESARYAYEAAKQLINGGPAFDIVRKYGGVQTGQMASEITNLTNPRIQAALAEALDGFDIDDPKASAMNLGRRILAAANKLDTNMSNAYQLSDTLFRVAKVQMDMDRGLTETEAFLNAQDLYLDYTIVPNFIRFIRTMPFGAPFISWTYLSTGLFLDKMGSSAVIHRNNEEFDENGKPKEIRIPHVFLMMPMVAVFAAMSAIFRADDFEDEDQKYLEVGLPKFTDGGVGLAFVGVDDQGRPVFFDWMKYFAGGTLFRIGAGMDNLRESDNRPVGFAGILKELGMGSDPATALFNIWVNSKDPNSGKPLDKQMSTGSEAFASQVGATVGLFLPPMLTPGGSNPILGDYGITNAAANRDSPTVAYEQGRPALALSQKLLRLTGAGIYVTDPIPDLDKKAKEATRVRSTVQSELRQAMKDEGLSPDVRDKKILEINKRYERAMEREEKAKAMLAEVNPFYQRLRAVTIAKSGVDPAIANAETMAARKEKTSQEEVLEAIRIAKGLEDARN
jgi:hypothetical protein